MSWMRALALATADGGSVGRTVASRTSLFDAVANAHLFGPPGFQCAPDGLRVVRQLRWQLLATGSTSMKSAVAGHMLRVYGAAVRQMTAHTSRHTTSTAPTKDALSPSQEAILVEQVQCLAEAKVHGVRLAPWHVRDLLQSALLATLGPELPLLVLREVADAPSTASPPLPRTAPPPESVLDCATGLAAAGYAAAAWALIAPYQHDPRVAAAFPDLVERVLRAHVDGDQQAVALVEQIPIAYLLEASDERGWIDGAARAYERQARRGRAAAAGAWAQRLLEAMQSAAAGTPTSSVSAGAGWEAVLRLAPLIEGARQAAFWQPLVDGVLVHNATVATTIKAPTMDSSLAKVSGVVPLAKLGRFLRRVGQPGVYLRLVCGSEVRCEALLDEARHGRSLLARFSEAAPLDEPRDAAWLNEALLALAATGAWRAALVTYTAWMDDHPPSLPPPNVATHRCIVRLILRPSTAAATASPPLTTETYSVCLRALQQIRRLDAAAPLPQDGAQSEPALQDKRPAPPSLSSEAEGLTESFVLWAATRGAWQDAVTWAALASTQHCRYAPLMALAAAAAAQRQAAGLHSVSHAVMEQGAETSLRGAEEAMQRMITALCGSPHGTWKQLCLLTAALSTTLAPAPLVTALALSEGAERDSSLVQAHGPDLDVQLQPAVVAEIVDAFRAHVGSSQAMMDQVIQQTVEYYISIRHRRAAAHEEKRVEEEERWLTACVRDRTRLLDCTLQLVAEAARGWGDDGDAGMVEARDDIADWHILAQVLRALSQAADLSLARAAPAVVSAGLKADVALHFLA